MKTKNALSAIAAAFALHTAAAHAVVFTSNTTLGVGNTTYDGQDIVVSNCTLTVDHRPLTCSGRRPAARNGERARIFPHACFRGQRPPRSVRPVAGRHRRVACAPALTSEFGFKRPWPPQLQMEEFVQRRINALFGNNPQKPTA